MLGLPSVRFRRAGYLARPKLHNIEDIMTIKVTIWNEGRHEQLHKEVQEIYPDRIDGAIAPASNTPTSKFAAGRSTIRTRACRIRPERYRRAALVGPYGP
jgi:hypothetical protein